MDYSGLRQSVSANKLSSVDVSQLDKINAIPNTITDNVLMEGLCQEDRHYLNALMDEDSSESEDDHTNPSRRMSSAWSPMAQSPITVMGASKSKRMRRMRPSYAITLSLEDISYIRPSWGTSKNIKKVKKKNVLSQANADEKPTKSSKAMKDKEFGVEQEEEEENDDEETATAAKEGGEKKSKRGRPFSAYHALLLLIMTLLILLMLLSYFVDLGRHQMRISTYKFKVDRAARGVEIYQFEENRLLKHVTGPVFKMGVGRGVPANLKSHECECDIFEQVFDEKDLGSLYRNTTTSGVCLACLDWSMRANLRVYLKPERRKARRANKHIPSLDEKIEPEITCYEFKWQSYDTLVTPLVDCFHLNDNEQWFGLGDLQTAHWPINSINFNQTPIMTNLFGEFGFAKNAQRPYLDVGHMIGNYRDANTTFKPLDLGSYVDFSLFTSSGFYLGNLKSDFQPSIWISENSGQPNTRDLCLSVTCTERCGSIWSRADHFDEWRDKNNILEYTVCSAPNWRDLVSKVNSDKARKLANKFIQDSDKTRDKAPPPTPHKMAIKLGKNSTVQEEQTDPIKEFVSISTTSRRQQSITDGIGLIERTIFATSPEFIPTLDGQTLRQFVDNIVKMGLKTSPILQIDARWQTYIGSFKLNTALFPKAKLLFEILHNKGLKIILTIKPYIENDLIGSMIHHLTESNRLYTDTRVTTPDRNFSIAVTGTNDFQRAHIIRRLSFFSIKNETILIRNSNSSKIPYLIPTRESRNSYSSLIDVTREDNRKWMIWLIKNSNWIAQEADGIQIAGAHPSSTIWIDHYREGLSQLVDDLFYKENLFTLPQWSDNFGFMQLAPRQRDWEGLQSTLESVLNLGSQGYALVHPGSVWGDFKKSSDEMDERELVIRWLQLSIFMPILQFKDLTPIEKYDLYELVQTLVKIRKILIVPEIKKNLPFTPLVGESKARRAQAESLLNEDNGQPVLPVIRRVWHNLGDPSKETIVEQQFLIGPDTLVAPILVDGQRQRDIFLPSGFWHDELRRTNIRGGKWLRNYPVELNEIAWFRRARR